MRESIVTTGPEETRAAAARLVARLPARSMLALHGDLGSGKTCFVQGLAQSLDVARPVTSPTFAMIHEYRGARPLVHIDLYRVRSPDEVLMLGFEEYLERDGIVAVEWAERAGDLLPASALHIAFEVAEGTDRRRITMEHAGSECYWPAGVAGWPPADDCS